MDIKSETDRSSQKREIGLTFKYSLASLCGFLTDLLILKIGVALGLSPAWARVVSLFTAMQVTFLINGFLIFKTIDPHRAHLQWAGYMITNAFGNLCNYLVFTTLLSLHRPFLSNHVFAVTVGALTAWVLNFTATRFWVFRRRGVEKTSSGAPPLKKNRP